MYFVEYNITQSTIVQSEYNLDTWCSSIAVLSVISCIFTFLMEPFSTLVTSYHWLALVVRHTTVVVYVCLPQLPKGTLLLFVQVKGVGLCVLLLNKPLNVVAWMHY